MSHGKTPFICISSTIRHVSYKKRHNSRHCSLFSYASGCHASFGGSHFLSFLKVNTKCVFENKFPT